LIDGVSGEFSAIGYSSFNIVYLRFGGMLGLTKRGNICKNGDTFLSLTKFCQS